MLSSMTGHGEASCQQDDLIATAEIRSTNNRYFKFSVRTSDGYSALEPRLERLIRKQLRRGSVHLALKIEHAGDQNALQINTESLLRFRDQLKVVPDLTEADLSQLLSALLGLPGVVEDRRQQAGDLDIEWPTIETAVSEATAQLLQMRGDEGQAMVVDLEGNVEQLRGLMESILERAPLVAAGYQQRLLERINKLLQEHSLTVDSSDVIRELGLFVDRSDISEEVVRLQSHLDQFSGEIQGSDAQGRKLDFLTQEMFREANTIGSKANDSQVSTLAIEVKTTIERMREMIQNVE